MDLDAYRDRMAAEHKQFSDAVMRMLTQYGQTQAVFSDLVRDVDQHLRDLHENDAELKRLILEQGSQLVDQGKQIAELRHRLDGAR